MKTKEEEKTLLVMMKGINQTLVSIKAFNKHLEEQNKRILKHLIELKKKKK